MWVFARACECLCLRARVHSASRAGPRVTQQHGVTMRCSLYMGRAPPPSPAPLHAAGTPHARPFRASSLPHATRGRGGGGGGADEADSGYSRAGWKEQGTTSAHARQVYDFRLGPKQWFDAQHASRYIPAMKRRIYLSIYVCMYLVSMHV